MKCFLCNFLRYCLLIYTIVATGGTIITRTRMTKTTTTTKRTIMTIETSPMDSNNCQANVECCYYREALEQQQQQQQQNLSGKKDIKLTKREIDERLQQPFTIMQSIEEEMEPEEDEDNKSTHKNDHVDDHDDDDDDDEEYEENSLDEHDYDDDDDDDDNEEIKANKKGIRRRRRRRKRRRKNRDKRPKRKRKKHGTASPLGQPANLLLASLTQLPTTPPIHYGHKYKPHRMRRRKKIATTTSKPKMKPLKYIINKGNLIKKKKQEYLSHLGYVFLPFVKFVAFFTVLNPFTLAVFFFMLISPVVFGLLGFTALSLILRPVMNLLFAVKHRVGNINRNNRRYRHKQQHKHNHNRAPRPITIHKHFYPQPRPIAHPPLFLRPTHRHRHRHPQRADNDKDISFHNSTEENGLVNVQQAHQNFNPLLPQVRHQLKQIQPPVGLSTRFILPTLQTH